LKYAAKPRDLRALGIVDPTTGISERRRLQVKGLTNAIDAGVMRQERCPKGPKELQQAQIKP
jgi:hypothetical protein